MQADGKILAGGDFTTIGGQTRNLFARLSNDTAALQNLAVTQTTITWTRGGSSPQFTRVTFESSTDNVNYTPLGNGTPAGSNWTLTGLSLSTGQNIYIRARGYYRTAALETARRALRNRCGTLWCWLGRRQLLPPSPTSRRGCGWRLAITCSSVDLSSPGQQAKKVIVRAIGPSLPVPGKLENPTLELHGPSGLITSSDNWMDAPNRQEIIDSTIAPTNDLESAILTTLPADGTGYTAIVRGVNNTTGIALVEAYDLDLGADSTWPTSPPAAWCRRVTTS